MSDSHPEYRAFRVSFARLVNGVLPNLESVAKEAFAKYLISREGLSITTNQHQHELYRTTKLLVKISARIQQNPACFDRFVSILKNIPPLQELALLLTSEYVKQLKEGRRPTPTANRGQCDPDQQSIGIPVSTDLSQKFSGLISQCVNTIAQEITPKILANVILCLNLFDSESDMDEPLVVDCKTDLLQASSNASIMEAVKPYMSPLNPELLGHIIEFLGTDQDCNNFKDYIKALEEYCIVTEVVLLQNQTNEKPEPEMAFPQVYITMEIPTMNLGNFRNLQSKMAKIFKLNLATLQVKLVSGKSPQICSLQLPNFAYKKVFPLSNEQKRELKVLGITSLKCGEYTCDTHVQVIDEAELEMPCLGRPFCLGMFYNCRNDNFLLGIQLCKDETIQAIAEEIPQVSHSCEVLEDDSLETKALSLQLTSPLKLSLMSNLIQNVSKSAKYWNDRCESKRQVRVALKYTSTTVKKQIPLDKLSEIQQNVFGDATHVVTGVLYGLDAYCTFDCTLRENEKFEDVHKSMLTMVNTLSSSDSSYSSIPPSASNCKVYSDSEYLYTLQENVIVSHFRNLHDLCPADKFTPVPKKVWLYPLKKLNNQCGIARRVSTRLVDQIQTSLEYLHYIQILANDLLNEHSVTLSRFQHIEKRVTKFTEIVTSYVNELQKNIANLLPQVRGGTVNEIELAKIVEESSTFESPFKCESLISWLKQIKEEIRTLEMLTNQMKDTEFMSSQELKSVASKSLDSDYMVCLAFHVALEDDQTINSLQSYLQSKEIKQSLSVDTRKWYANPELMKKIESSIEHFRAFMESNSRNKNTEFTLTNCKPIETQSAAADQSEPTSILLCEGTTCKPWEPPGPPGKPTVKETATHDTVYLQWSRPEYGCQNVECYQVSYHQVDQPQDNNAITTNSAQTNATISGLAASTKYVFTVQSKCKVGLGAKGETSDSVETQQAPVVEPAGKEASSDKNVEISSKKPRATATTHNSITLEWALPEENGDNIDCYTISYRKVDDSTKKWKKITTTSSEQKNTVSDLSPQTSYIFKVRPELDDDEVGPWSEVSDPIETKALSVCRPWKPRGTATSYNSVTLEWDKPEHNSSNVQSYLVRYAVATQSKLDWKRVMTDSSETKFIVSNLAPQTKYVFKIRPELDDGVGTWSEVSDPIETKAETTHAAANDDKVKPTATAVTHHSITLQWSRPDGSKNVEMYHVNYRSVEDQSKKWKKKTTESSEEHITLTGLSSQTKYIFKVRPEFEDDDFGAWSEVSDPIETKAETIQVASGSTSKPTATLVTYDSISLQWSRPEGSKNVEMYHVNYRSVGDQTCGKRWKKKTTESSEEHITITQLTPKTKYIFRIRPEFEDDDFGVWSETNDPIETKTCLPRFDKPRTSIVTQDSVELKLTKPENGTEDAQCLTVCYQVVGSDNNEWNQKPIDNAQGQELFTINELHRNTEYVFKVFCRDGTNVGPESEVSVPIRTKATSPPSKPVASAVTYNEIKVMWNKPKDGHEDIKSYSVSYYPKKQCEKKYLMEVADEEATISSLAPLESYVINVQPICKTGVGVESEPSDPIQTKATSQPGKPVVTKVTHDSIALKWDAPEYCYEDIDHYCILYRSTSVQLDDKSWKQKKSSSAKLACVIPALVLNTTYVFKIHPVCKSGEGCESSLSELIKTKSASPPGKPIAIDATHDGIKLKWSKPICGSNNGINYAILQKKAVSTEEWKEAKTSSMSTTVQMKGLDPATEYLFKIKLLCGQTDESDESEISDPVKTKPVCKPGKPYATVVTQNSIVLKWEIPEQYSTIIERYTIDILQLTTITDFDQVETIKARPNSKKTESCTISGLSPGSQYKFKVVPHGNSTHHPYVESELSDLIVTKVTSQPENVKIQDVTNDTVTVKWSHPNCGKEHISHYTVCYRSLSDPPSDWKEQNTSGRQTHQIVTGLSMKTTYVFTVIPQCKEGKKGTESESSIQVETPATSSPGVPEATEVTHETISLKWTPPDVGEENVSSYSVYYCSTEAHQLFQWKEQTAADNSTEIIIGGLDTNRYYQFKVKANCKPGCGNGAESKISKPIQTSKCCKISKLRTSDVTHNKIVLVWDKPLYGYENIMHYEVKYRVGKVSVAWKQRKTEGRHEKIEITNLSPNEFHMFKVKPLCKPASMHAPFFPSGYIKTEDWPLAERMLKQCSPADCIDPGSVDRIQVNRIPNRRQDMNDSKKKIAKYHIGKPIPGNRERVIMLVGATGAGKSTLINSIANYVLGVSWDTPFRFKLIEDEMASQAHSQTSWITAYTFHAQKDSPVLYDLTIVDTPGFGDTRGIQRDKAVTAQIKEFFSVKPPYGIDSIHAIGFVAQAALARLTPTQKYVFDSILAMFGKDIADNIFLMATFADGEEPQVTAAIKEANIKCKQCIKFNNSVLYTCTSKSGQFGQLFWKMNEGSMKRFFESYLTATKSISLQLTKEVLQKREHLEALVLGLQEKIKMGLNVIQEMQQEEKILKDCKTSVLDPNFTYELEVAKTKQVKLPDGIFVTNCTECNFTCHFPCTISDNSQKYLCAAMGGTWITKYMFSKKENIKCEVCPQKCHWEKHEQQDYRIEVYKEKEVRTLQDLMERYLESADGSTESDVTDKMLSSAREKLKALNKEVLDLIKQTQRCVKRLHEIAYKPHPLNEVAYIDLMIESEKREGKDGFEGRVCALEELKEQAALVSTLANPADDTDVEAEPKPQSWWSYGRKAVCVFPEPKED